MRRGTDQIIDSMVLFEELRTVGLEAGVDSFGFAAEVAHADVV